MIKIEELTKETAKDRRLLSERVNAIDEKLKVNLLKQNTELEHSLARQLENLQNSLEEAKSRGTKNYHLPLSTIKILFKKSGQDNANSEEHKKKSGWYYRRNMVIPIILTALFVSYYVYDLIESDQVVVGKPEYARYYKASVAYPDLKRTELLSLIENDSLYAIAKQEFELKEQKDLLLQEKRDYGQRIIDIDKQLNVIE